MKIIPLLLALLASLFLCHFTTRAQTGSVAIEVLSGQPLIGRVLSADGKDLYWFAPGEKPTIVEILHPNVYPVEMTCADELWERFQSVQVKPGIQTQAAFASEARVKMRGKPENCS